MLWNSVNAYSLLLWDASKNVVKQKLASISAKSVLKLTVIRSAFAISPKSYPPLGGCKGLIDGLPSFEKFALLKGW